MNTATKETKMTTYEFRTNDNPNAMPYGTGTISTHATLDEAHDAQRRENHRFHKSRLNDRAWLPRVIVQVDEDGKETICAEAEPWVDDMDQF